MGKGCPLGSLVCDVFLCFVTIHRGVLCQVWYLIILVPDHCLLPLSFKWQICHRRKIRTGFNFVFFTS